MEFVWHSIHLTWQSIVGFFAFDSNLLTTPEMILRLTLQVLLLLGSSFFSGSETALFSLSRLDMQNLRRKRNPHVDTLQAQLDQPRRLIISILCGNELINIAAAANMAGILVVLYGDSNSAFWINILVMVPLLLLFGEVTPKTIAVSHPVRFSITVAPALNLWVRFIAPVRTAIRIVADRVTTFLVGEVKNRANILQVDEFRSLVEEVSEEGVLDADERMLIYNLLEAGDTEVVEIMTPRTRTCFLSTDLSVPEIVEKFREYRHSRVPVFLHQRDNLVGFLHAEDVLRLVLDKKDLNTVTLENLIRPPVVVPPTKRVDEMLDFFKEHNVRAAVVLNEFGGVEGFVTLTNVLTFIFGPLTGEVHGEEYYREHDENLYEVPGQMKLTDFNNLTHFGIEDPRMTTVAGVVFRHLDRLPRQGDKVVLEDITFSVLEMDQHRIAKVRVAKGRAEMKEETVGSVQQPEEEPADGTPAVIKENSIPDDVNSKATHLDEDKISDNRV